VYLSCNRTVAVTICQ